MVDIVTIADGDTNWGATMRGNLQSLATGINQTNTLVAAKYSLPSGGIPSTDLASAVRAQLTLASSAYQKASGGIPATDLASTVQGALNRANSAVLTVNGYAPDASGNVAVSGGGGGGGAVNSVNGMTGDVLLGKSDVGLGNVDNTSDANKPVSSAQSAAIGAKYTKPSQGIPATDLADSVQTSLTKADSAVQPSALAAYVKTVNGTAPDANGNVAVSGGSGGVTSVNGRTGDVTLAKSDVGLTNVDNTSDVNKPVSTAQSAAINAKYTKPSSGIPASDMSSSVQGTLSSAATLFGNLDLSGVTVYGFGNSWVASPSGGITQYVNRAVSALNASSYVNIATSGYRMQDSAIEAVTGQQVQAKAFPQGVDGVVVIGDLLNNGVEADTTTNRNAALEGMRTLVALARASRRIEQDDSTFSYSTSPAWVQTNQSKVWASGTTASLTNNQGAYVDFTLPAGVTTYFMGDGTDPASFAGATVEFRRAGSTTDVAATQVYDSKWLKTTYHADGLGPVVTKLDWVQQKNNRIRAITTSTGYFFVDGMLPQHKTGHGPVVFIVKPVPVLNANYQKTALNTFLRTVPDTVAAEFGPDVVVIDPISGWNANTMLLDDNLHPNEAGAAYLGTFVANAIKAELSRRLPYALNAAMGLI